MKFTEQKLEKASTELLSQERFFSHLGITKTQNLEKKRNLVYIYLFGLNLIKSKNGNS